MVSSLTYPNHRALNLLRYVIQNQLDVQIQNYLYAYKGYKLQIIAAIGFENTLELTFTHFTDFLKI